jgi:curved DNA-binding protein CbpA
MHVATGGPEQEFFIHYEDCDGSSKRSTKSYYDIYDIGDIEMVFCFLPIKGTNYIPYSIDDKGNYSVTDSAYGIEIERYVDERISSFSFSSKVRKFIKVEYRKLYWERWFEQLKERLVIGMVILGFITAFSYATGWVVRGFAGIPKGSDRRPER